MKNKSMRRWAYVTIVALMLCAVLLGGCSLNNKHPYLLTEHSWTHFATCNENISFGQDGSYAYFCDCGEQVDDSDLFDEYEYDERQSLIELKPESNDSTIKVLRQEKSRLLLDFGDVVKEFVDMDDPVMAEAGPENLGYDVDGVTTGFSSYVAMLRKDGSTVITAPATYDGDNDEFDDYMLTEIMADDVEFHEWSLNVANGSEGEGIDSESSCRRLDESEAVEIIGSGHATGFVWYNEKAEIAKIVFDCRTSH